MSESHDGNKYASIFVDDVSRHLWVYTIPSKVYAHDSLLKL
jgi:hypothetical protein